MGMFDYVKVNMDLLPISDDEKKLLGSNPGWQTKSHEDLMCVLEITDDFTLIYHREIWEWDSSLKGLKFIRTDIENVPDAEIHFYATDKNNHWYEFDAVFEHGKLKSLKGGKVSEVDFYK